MRNYNIGDSVRVVYPSKYPAGYYGQDRRIDNYLVTGKVGTIAALNARLLNSNIEYLVDIDGLIFLFSFYSLEKIKKQSRMIRIK